jgi:serine/threonine protein kinase
VPQSSDPNQPTITGPTDGDVSATAPGGPAPPIAIGTKIDNRYLVERELARGGMGAVYLAIDKPELMSRKVVIKVLLEDGLKNSWVVQKFHQEIESLTKLDDPGIVAIVDAGKLPDNSPYLVMQFIDGTNLRPEIRPGGIELTRVAELMRQIGRTVKAAHAAGIIHRDLKPENIMLRRTKGGEEQIKIVDFGIAKVKDSVIAPSTVTGAGSAGTIGYMPPEQLEAKTITPATDIYALGVIAFELLTGVRPFNPKTGYQLLEMQRKGLTFLPRAVRPEIPESAQKVVLKALAFNAKDRFQDASEFTEALVTAFADEDPLEASTDDLTGGQNGGLDDLRRRSAVDSSYYSRVDSEPLPENPPRSMELAHVLFLDIVGYTRLPIDRQTQALDRLHAILQSTKDFARSAESKQLLRLPSGDGMALVFFGDQEAPVRCAVEVSRALREHPDLGLRMGVHSGPVDPIVDVNGKKIVTGTGINTAQRVMDCGDAGHILLSKRVADDLGQYSRWQPYLHDLGETEVKNGVRIHLFNLYLGDVGNSELPAKFKKPGLTPLTIGLIAVAVVVLVAGGLLIWRPWNGTAANTNTNTERRPGPGRTERGFTYYLTRSENGKSVESDRFTGAELFHNGDKFVFVMLPAQSGSFYLLDRSSADGQPDSWYVLFPTPGKNGGAPSVESKQKLLVDLFFGNKPGDENLTLIFAPAPIPELEPVFKAAARNGFKVTDPNHLAVINEYLARNGATEPNVSVDPGKIETTVKGANDVVIRKFTLRHRQLQ